jgi:hypothetical protein
VNPEITKKSVEAKWLKSMFHEAALSPYQVSVLYPKFMKMISAAEAADKKAGDERFAKLSSDVSKTRKTSTSRTPRSFMATHIPAEMQPMLNELARRGSRFSSLSPTAWRKSLRAKIRSAGLAAARPVAAKRKTN